MRLVHRIGDSYTVGYVTFDGGAFGAAWTTARQPFAFVGTVSSTIGRGPHDGHGGWTTAQVLAALPTWIAAAHPTDAIVMLGTNDGAWGLPVATALGNLERIVRLLASSGARVTVGTIPDVVGAGAKLMPKLVAWVPEYNAGIARMVARLNAVGVDVRKAEPEKVISDPSLYAPDGVHLTTRGYELVGAELGRVSAAEDRPKIEVSSDAGAALVALVVLALLLLKR